MIGEARRGEETMGNERRCPLGRNQSVTGKRKAVYVYSRSKLEPPKAEMRDFRKCDITTGRQPGIAIADIHKANGTGMQAVSVMLAGVYGRRGS